MIFISIIFFPPLVLEKRSSSGCFWRGMASKIYILQQTKFFKHFIGKVKIEGFQKSKYSLHIINRFMIHKTLPFFLVENFFYFYMYFYILYYIYLRIIRCNVCKAWKNWLEYCLQFTSNPLLDIIFCCFAKSQIEGGMRSHVNTSRHKSDIKLDKHGTRQKASDNVCVQYAL